MKHLFILNPMAGKGKSLKLIPEIHKIFSSLEEEYKIEITQKPGHATEIVREYTLKDNYRVYAVGGDGTLNEVLNGIVDTNSSIAVIPAGSGNDFIKSITETPKKDILYRTIKGKEQPIDIGIINDQYFLNVASLGIDAKIVFNAKHLKKLPFFNGFMAYYLSILYTIFNFNSENLTVKIDDNEFNTTSLLIAFGNGSYYGGGMKVLPNAEVADGFLEVCHVKALKKFKMLRFFPLVIKGKHESLTEYVSFYKCKTTEVSCDKPMPINIDGELAFHSKISVKILPNKINFVIPEAL